MRTCSWVLVVCSSVIVASCQAKQPEPAAPAAAQPPYTTTATVKDIMLHIVDPAGDMVWDSVSTIIDKGGIHETVPKTDEEWIKVRNGVITLIEGSNLLMIPGRAMARPGEKSEAPGVELEPAEMEELINKDRAGWNQRARDLHDISVESAAHRRCEGRAEAVRHRRGHRQGVRELPPAVLVSQRSDPAAARRGACPGPRAVEIAVNAGLAR